MLTHESAGNMCVIQSLLATCRNHDINPRLYLNSVIASMPYFDKASHEDLVQLLPHKWKEWHPILELMLTVHELAHFHVREHDDKFTTLLDTYLPDWKARKQELDNFIALALPKH